MKETKIKGIFEIHKRKKSLYTINLTPKKTVYREKTIIEKGIEYREWDPNRSKLAAAILKDIKNIKINENDTILYLGCSTGTTVSHVSDIVREKGKIFAVDIAPRVMREMVFLAEERKNIIPLLVDANKPEKILPYITGIDFIYQDIAQKNQVKIFLKNLIFLKEGGQAFLCIKARSIDTTRKPASIFNEIKEQLRNKVKLLDFKTLEPYQKDHCIFLIQK